MKSKIISISAISEGFIAILLTIGSYFEITDLITTVVASCLVLLPLYYNSYKGMILTYLVGGVIAFMFSGFNLYTLVFPAYFLFGGIYPIISTYLRERKNKNILVYVVGAIYTALIFVGLYYYYVFFMKVPVSDLPKFIQDNIIMVMALLGVVFYFVFDRFIVLVRKLLNYYLGKIIK